MLTPTTMLPERTLRNPVEALAEEYARRLRAGERPSAGEYAQLHPELADEIADLFPAIAMMEECSPARRSGSRSGARRDSHVRVADHLGEFHLLREIGRGGMGVVYEAEQSSLGRRVALKILASSISADNTALARFQREAAAAAKLHHTNIVPVFGMGECDGVHFYAMQFIAGKTLQELLRERDAVKDDRTRATRSRVAAAVPIVGTDWDGSRSDLAPTEVFPVGAGADAPTAPLTVDAPTEREISGLGSVLPDGGELDRWVARIGLQAAEALAHANDQGVLHRDIKPSNLMLDSAGNVWVTDFGLAKQDGSEDLTAHGSVIGTLRYLAPERLHGVIDRRSDLFALGLCLYELLTGRPAFDAADGSALLKQVSAAHPPSLRQFHPTIPRDLETIVLKLLDREPSRRYQTAHDAADDLRRFLEDLPVRARRVGPIERWWRWSRRNPVVAGLTAAVLVLMAVATGISLAAATRLERENKNTLKAEAGLRESLDLITQTEREKTDQLWQSKLNEALSLRYSGHTGQRWEAWDRLTEATQLAQQLGAGEESRRRLRNAAISTLALTDLRYDRPGPSTSPGAEIFAFDPTLTKYLRRDAKGHVSVRDVQDDIESVLLVPPAGTYGAGWPSFSADGRFLALWYLVRSKERPVEIVIWDLLRGEKVFSPGEIDQRGPADFSADGKTLVLASETGQVVVFDVPGQRESGRFKLACSPAYVRINPQGDRLAVRQPSKSGHEVWVVDLLSGLVLHRFALDEADQIAWHPQGKLLAVTANDFNVHVFNLENGREQCVMRGHGALPHQPAFTPDGEVLVTSTYDGTVRLWNAWTGQELVRGPAQFMSFLSADGRRLAVQQGDQYVFYDVLRSDVYHSLPLAAVTPTDRFHCNPAAQHPGTRWLPVVGFDGLRLLDPATGQELAKAPIGASNGFCWSPNGDTMYTGGSGGLKCWPVAETDHAYVIGPPEALGPKGVSVGISSVHPNGKQLVFKKKGYPYLMNLEANSSAPVRMNHIDADTTPFSPDGQWLAMGNHHGWGLRVWRVGEDKLSALLLPEVRLTSARFSPDSRVLAGSVEGMVRLWRVGDWQPLRTAMTVGGHYPGYGFSPDGRLLAYSRTPHEICLEDVETGRHVALIEATDDSQVGTPLFSRDGSQLIVGRGYPATVRVWNLAALRERLNEIGLADDLPEWPAPQPIPSQKPIRFDLGLSAKQLYTAAQKHRGNRQYAEACACMEQCLAREPDQLTYLRRLALLRVFGPAIVRNVAQAEQLCLKAVEIDPEHPYVLNTLGVVQYRLGRYAEALATLQRASELSLVRKLPLQLSVAGFPRAMTLHRLGRVEEARTAYDEAAKWLAANRTTGFVHESDMLQTEAAWVLGIRDP